MAELDAKLDARERAALAENPLAIVLVSDRCLAVVKAMDDHMKLRKGRKGAAYTVRDTAAYAAGEEHSKLVDMHGVKKRKRIKGSVIHL